MQKSLAIMATTAMLALSLAGCGAERNGDVDLMPDFDGNNGGGTSTSDTMQNGTGGAGGMGTANGSGSAGGTGTANGTGSAGGNGSTTGTGNESGTGLSNGVTGAMNRSSFSGAYQYGSGASNYTATNNGGLTAMNGSAYSGNGQGANATGDRYERMLENGRVRDRDGFLLDGENTSYRTF